MSIAKVCKFQKERREISTDCGESWQRTSDTRKIDGVEPVERNSTDCGFQVSKRTVTSGYTCNGYDKYTQLVDEVSYDGEETWEVISGSSRLGVFVERFSSDCCQLRTYSATVCTELFQHAIADVEEASLDGINWIHTGRYTITEILEDVDWDCLKASNVKYLGLPHSGTSGLSYFSYSNYTNNGDSGKTAVGADEGYVIIECDRDIDFRVTDKHFPNGPIDSGLLNGEIQTMSGLKSIYIGDCVENPTIYRGEHFGSYYEEQMPNFNSLETVFISSGASGDFSAPYRIFPSGVTLVFEGGSENTQLSSINIDSYYGGIANTSLHLPITCNKKIVLTNSPSLSSLTIDARSFSESGSSFSSNTALQIVTFAYDFYGEICRYMFYNCSALQSVTLGNPTLIDRGAFQNCTSLSSIILGDSVTYIGEHAFDGCTALRDVYIEQTENILSNVYSTSFPSGCTIHVPNEACSYWKQAYEVEHPELGVSIACYTKQYRWVESGWTCIDYDKYTNNVEQISLDNGATWVNTGVESASTLIEANSIDCGYVPQYSGQYLTFVATESGTFKFNGTSGNSVSYSLDNGSTWNTLASGTDSPTVSSGDKIMWKASGMTIHYGTGIGRFSSDAEFTVEGNIMSLHYGDDFSGQTRLLGYEFYSMFSGCTTLTSAENLVLPATQLGSWCYARMFYDCTSLTTAPELPATTLAEGCYARMFQGCWILSTAPELPATTLASECYWYMFYNCFSLETAPELPATTLASECYSYMFRGCYNLNYIKCLATDISASECTYKWTYGVSSSGTFVKNASMTNWTIGIDGIPSNWTVVNAY